MTLRAPSLAIPSAAICALVFAACGPALPSNVTEKGKELAPAIDVRADEDPATGSFSRSIIVQLKDANGEVTDATVDIDPGGTLAFDSQNASFTRYHLENLPDAETYTVHITRGPDALTATLSSPGAFTFATSPSPPKVATAADVTWTPSGSDGVTSLAAAIPLGGVIAVASELKQGKDTGQATLSANAFKDAGKYRMRVERSREVDWACLKSGTSFSADPRGVNASESFTLCRTSYVIARNADVDVN